MYESAAIWQSEPEAATPKSHLPGPDDFPDDHNPCLHAHCIRCARCRDLDRRKARRGRDGDRDVYAGQAGPREDSDDGNRAAGS